MAAMIITHHVKDFTAWKKVFDSMVQMRKSAGELSTQLYRDASDPNQLTLVQKWNSVADAQKFTQSADLKAAMESAGVDSAPMISILNEV